MLFRYLGSLLLVSSSLLSTNAQTCSQLLASDPTLSILNGVVTDLELDISNTVIWAPVDSAFDFGADPTLERIATNELFVPQLRQLILNHAVAGMDSDVSSGTVTTLTGETLTVTGGMVPETIEGFAEEEISVLETVEGSDCVVYKIDGILTPAWWEISILELAASGDLVGLRNLTTIFSTIEPATLATASLVPAVTVFAPSDEGFAKLGEAKAYYLLESDLLQPILFNHLILSKNVDSTMIEDSISIGLLMQIPYDVTRSPDGAITLGTAKITMPDIFANNGIVHVIDEVLFGTVEIPDIPTEAPVLVTTEAPVVAPTRAPLPTTDAPLALDVMIDPVVSPTNTPVAVPAVVARTEAPVVVTPEETESPVVQDDIPGLGSSSRPLYLSSTLLCAILIISSMVF